MAYPLARLSVLLAVTVTSPARAADWYTGAEVPVDRDAWIVAIDASATVSSQGSQFTGATVTAAPQDSLLVSGPRIRVDGLIGSYRTTNAVGGSAFGQQDEAAALVGHAWVSQDASLSGFIGLNVRRNAQSSITTSSGTDRTEVGLKGAIDYYARPTSATMVHATGSYSTTFNAYFGRIRGGVLAFGNGYLGPELALLGDDYYRQWRAGVHWSGVQFGAVQIGLSAGYLHDAARKGGLYSTVDLRTGF